MTLITLLEYSALQGPGMQVDVTCLAPKQTATATYPTTPQKLLRNDKRDRQRFNGATWPPRSQSL